ncbi:MAG: hypothetical protein QOK37_2038 [Thermoanaerobaculia bacterium]|jgi:RimJ/RimL family protein N-acetyltransferase|nr:hypothetical protein [Thermoanaerobaculia bacterium]
MAIRQPISAETLEAGEVSVRLRPVALDDAERMFAWMCDPDVRRNVGVRAEPSLEATLSWIDRAEVDEGTLAWAIEASGRHVGNLVLDQLDPMVQSVRLSVYIGEKDLRSKGIAGKAITLALTDAFEQRGIQKVWLTVVIDNTSAIRCYHRCGFRIEGILRQTFFAGNAIKDAFYMGITRRDYDSMNPA